MKTECESFSPREIREQVTLEGLLREQHPLATNSEILDNIFYADHDPYAYLRSWEIPGVVWTLKSPQVDSNDPETYCLQLQDQALYGQNFAMQVRVGDQIYNMFSWEHNGVLGIGILDPSGNLTPVNAIEDLKINIPAKNLFQNGLTIINTFTD